MQADPLPYFYHPIHSTYVLNISSAYPTHAHLVATTSMDGETRLWSIADHEKDAVETTRMRVGSPHLTYSPWLQSFLSSDENDFVRMLTLRRFFATLAVARLPSTLSALATCSSWHPSVLFGSTGGVGGCDKSITKAAAFQGKAMATDVVFAYLGTGKRIE